MSLTSGSIWGGTSSDLWLNPHLHLVALDGAWHEEGGELCWQGLGHLQTSEVGAVLESTVRRIERHLGRRGLLGIDEDDPDPDLPGDPESNLLRRLGPDATGRAAVGESPRAPRAACPGLRQATVRVA